MDEKTLNEREASNNQPTNWQLPQPGVLGTWTFDPTYNVMFQRLFGQDASVKVTPHFLNCLLEAKGLGTIETDDVQISSETALVGGTIECKTPRMDVRIISPSWRVDIEVQRGKEHVGDRMAFYVSKLLSDSLGVGHDYSEAPRVLVVMLYSYQESVIESDDFIHLGRMTWDSTNNPVSNKVQLLLVELNKFKQQFSSLNSEVLQSELYAWLYYLTNGYRDKKERSILEEKFPSLVEFAKLYGLAIDDPKTASIYNAALEAEIDYNSHLSIARKDGLAEGRAKGLAEGRVEGLAEGRVEGLAEGRVASIRALMANCEADANEVCNMLDIPEEDRETLFKLL